QPVRVYLAALRHRLDGESFAIGREQAGVLQRQRRRQRPARIAGDQQIAELRLVAQVVAEDRWVAGEVTGDLSDVTPEHREQRLVIVAEGREQEQAVTLGETDHGVQSIPSPALDIP